MRPTALAFAAPATNPAPIPTREAAQAAAPAAPITVASADGDPATYRKLLGNLFGGAPAAPPVAPAAPPAADTTPVAAISPAAPLPKKVTARFHPAAHTASVKVDGLNPAAATKADGKPADAKHAAETKPAAKPAEKVPEAGKRTEAPNRNRVAASQPAN